MRPADRMWLGVGILAWQVSAERAKLAAESGTNSGDATDDIEGHWGASHRALL